MKTPMQRHRAEPQAEVVEVDSPSKQTRSTPAAPKSATKLSTSTLLVNAPLITRQVCLPAMLGFVLGAIIMVVGGAWSDTGSLGGNLVMQLFKASKRSYVFASQQTATMRTVISDNDQPVEAIDVETISDVINTPPIQTNVKNEDTETPDYLTDTAIVTLATGDISARDALGLLASLREVNTRVPNIIVLLARGGLGSADCNNDEWRRKHDRMHISCGGLDTIAPEIASQQFLDAFTRMNATYQVVDPIPDTNYTIIPGGRQIFWGMAFNKLLVFGMTQYRKLLWMDSDAYVIKNIDHLMKEPMLTGAMVTACCHPGGPAYAGGGIWVVEPSKQLFADIMDMIAKPVPGTKDDPWHWGDMQVVRHFFGVPPPKDSVEPYWPAINDGRHGYAPGLRYLPKYRNMTTEEFDKMMDEWLDRGKQRREGFIPELWDGKRPAWRALDVRYDQCVGHCQCAPERFPPDVLYSVHFSCLHDIGKPGGYTSEHHLMSELYKYSESCSRYWFLRWYDTYTRAHGRYPPPYWEGPPVPAYNETHDAIVFANRLKRDSQR